MAAGDLVVEVQGIRVAGAKAEALKPALQGGSVGETLHLKVQRGGSGQPREVTLVAVPKP